MTGRKFFTMLLVIFVIAAVGVLLHHAARTVTFR